MADLICLAIDAMGGDLGPRFRVLPVVDFLRQHPHVHAILFGDESQINSLLENTQDQDISSRLVVRHCSQVVAMDEKPSSAIRTKRNSSMWHALGAVGSGEAQACISSGSTGALMGMSLFQIKAFESVSRPAICTAVPARNGQTYLLDVGANLECSAQQLHQFARMASKLVSVVKNIPSPSVGLLNVGVEQGKGGQILEEAAALLSSDRSLRYQGFVEGDDIYLGTTDIVVCDGFNGNVVLKASEGLAKIVAERLKAAFKRSLLAKFVGLLSLPVLRTVSNDFDPSRYNGASLLGLRGVVVKSHGSADQRSFSFALQVALSEAEENLPNKIERALNSP